MRTDGLSVNQKFYGDKLRDPRWQRRRLEILNRDGFKCTCCGDTSTELQIHHTEYHSYNPWEALDEHLTTLCKYCHEIQRYLLGPCLSTFKHIDKYGYMHLYCYCSGGVMVFKKIENGRLAPQYSISYDHLKLLQDHLPIKPVSL